MICYFLKELALKNKKTNLVGKSTLVDPWVRHICDSIQILLYIKNKKSKIIDMGTGAGIPGVILSIMGFKNIYMIDSIKKKTSFVKKIINDLGLSSKVITSRLEDLKLGTVNYIVSRALAPLDKLINYSLLFSNKDTTLVFLKGRSVKKEIKDAKKVFNFDYSLFKSKSSDDGYVLKIINFKVKLEK